MTDHPARAARWSLAWAGLVLGLIALAIAVLPGWIAPIYDPPGRTIPERATDWLGRLTGRAAEAIGGAPAQLPPAEPPNPWRDARIGLTALLLAFAALVLAVVGFARREDTRVVACAVVVTAGAVASQALLTSFLIVTFALAAAWLLTIAERSRV